MHFTDATKRVQVVSAVFEPCSQCTGVFEVDAVISVGPTCATKGFESAFRSPASSSEWAAYINATHRLSVDEGESPIIPCRWTATEDVSSLAMFLDIYANTSCTNPVDRTELVVSMFKEVTLGLFGAATMKFELTTETGGIWDTIDKESQLITPCFGEAPGPAFGDTLGPDPLWNLGTCTVHEVP